MFSHDERIKRFDLKWIQLITKTFLLSSVEDYD